MSVMIKLIKLNLKLSIDMPVMIKLTLGVTKWKMKKKISGGESRPNPRGSKTILDDLI